MKKNLKKVVSGAAGEYKLSVCAVTESGNVSSLAANVVFTVE